jgi:hypothetical protein
MKIMKTKKNIENMRDCVRHYFEKGVRDKHAFRDMEYAIICEFKRLDYDKEEIAKQMKIWNNRNYKKLTCKEFNNKIVSFINWIFKKDAKVGCNYFNERGYCMTPCKFKANREKKSMQQVASEPFYLLDDIDKFLKEYDKCKNHRLCAEVYKIIDNKRIKLGLNRDSIIFISFRQIVEALWEKDYRGIKPMQASRLVHSLIDSGLIEVAKKGTNSPNNGKANGYKINIPEDVLDDDLMTYKEE